MDCILRPESILQAVRLQFGIILLFATVILHEIANFNSMKGCVIFRSV